MSEQNTIELDESLYATLRIITIFLKADGRVHSKELNWFKWLIQNRVSGAEQSERTPLEGLMNDLQSPPELEEVLGHVNRSDRMRLIAWARIAVHVDGHISAAEKKLYERLLIFSEQKDFETSHQELGRATLESHKRVQFWSEIMDASEYFKQPVRLRDIFFPGGIILKGFLNSNRLITGLLIFFILIVFVIQIFF